MKVTKQWIDEYKTARGGWTRAQLAAIGVSWPPVKGWKDRAVGRHINVVSVATFQNESRLSKMAPSMFSEDNEACEE